MNYRPKLRSADTEGGAQPSAASAWVLALCCLLSLGSPTLAQPPDEPVEDAPTGEFFEVVNVEIANIDVWVTDKEGDPVVGLQKDDFVVTRDGETVDIANFYAVSGGRTSATPPPRETSAESDSRDRSRALDRGAIAQRTDLPAEHQLWLVVYIDNYNVDPNERNRIVPALRAFLSESLRSGSQTMTTARSRWRSLLLETFLFWSRRSRRSRRSRAWPW